MRHLGVIGGGAWGSALAAVAAAGGPVTLWVREPEVADAINRGRENPQFLPGIRLPDAIGATADLDALAECDAAVVVVPVQFLRTVLASAPVDGRPLLLCSKGMEISTRLLPSEIAADAAPASSRAVLSGPSFAREVAMGLPTALTLAAAEAGVAADWLARLAQPAFRLYASDDPIGAEIGGAVKNVLAIACGVVIGAGLGENARAALISRGFAEMTRYGVARGARADTLTGLSGLGDLVLTCGSEQSRNMSLGAAIGRGERAADVIAARPTVAEGAATAPALAAHARDLGVDMPIVTAVAQLLAGEAPVGDVVAALLSRPLRAE